MISIQGIAATSRPRPEVFAYVADFTKVAEWDPGIRSSTRVSGDGGVGTRYEVAATFAGRVVPMTYEVIEHAVPSRLVLRGSAEAVEAVDTIDFQEAPEGGTRVVYRADFTLKGGIRRFAFLMKPLFGRLGRKAIAGLEASLNR
ncbi:MAG: polyketide cyclase [Actinobacteria bacterium]|nr:polyketide cyclase [Actinomycetota bacterium]